MSNRAPDYPERQIRALPKHLQVFMVRRVLDGYKFRCGDLTNAGNRWWQVYHPDTGRAIPSIGGLQLQDVLRRLAKYLTARASAKVAREHRNGLLAQEHEAASPQLGD